MLKSVKNNNGIDGNMVYNNTMSGGSIINDDENEDQNLIQKKRTTQIIEDQFNKK